MRIPPVSRASLAALLVLASGCDGGTGPELGGEYVASLDSPFSAEGAAVIELTHPDLRSVRAPGRILVARGASERTLRIVVINPPGTGAGGPITFVVRMAKGAVPPRAQVLAVSGPDNRVRDFATGYAVRFTRLMEDDVLPGYSPPPGSYPTPPVPFARLVEPLLPGGAAPFPELVALADRTGNSNDAYDVGDVRGYLLFYPSAIPAPAPWTR
jgi:hypothetical protein